MTMCMQSMHAVHVTYKKKKCYAYRFFRCHRLHHKRWHEHSSTDHPRTLDVAHKHDFKAAAAQPPPPMSRGLSNLMPWLDFEKFASKNRCSGFMMFWRGGVSPLAVRFRFLGAMGYTYIYIRRSIICCDSFHV